MQVVYSLDDLLTLSIPSILTIGNFDGVHLGHQYLIEKVVTRAKQEKLLSSLITFQNHPSTILRPNHKIPLLTSSEAKLKLLEKLGIDIVVMLPFTKELSEKTAEKFLDEIQLKLPIRELVLGKNAKIGKDRLGDGQALLEIAEKHHFNLTFLPLLEGKEGEISSTKIRRDIATLDFEEAKSCLGRPYSLFSTIRENEGALFLTSKGLALPPRGVYSLKLLSKGKTAHAIGYLGYHFETLLLEEEEMKIVLLSHATFEKEEMIEVVFTDLLRAEQKVSSLEEETKLLEKDLMDERARLASHSSL